MNKLIFIVKNVIFQLFLKRTGGKLIRPSLVATLTVTPPPPYSFPTPGNNFYVLACMFWKLPLTHTCQFYNSFLSSSDLADIVSSRILGVLRLQTTSPQRRIKMASHNYPEDPSRNTMLKQRWINVVCFILDLILSALFLRYCTYELGIFHANQTTKGEGWSNNKLVEATPTHPVSLLLAVPRRFFCFGSLVVLDVVCTRVDQQIVSTPLTFLVGILEQLNWYR